MKKMLLILGCLALTLAALGCDKKKDLPVCDPGEECGYVTDYWCTGNDLAIECQSGYECKNSCSSLCADDGMTYVGTCDNEYQGTPSPSGDDACWCI